MRISLPPYNSKFRAHLMLLKYRAHVFGQRELLLALRGLPTALTGSPPHGHLNSNWTKHECPKVIQEGCILRSYREVHGFVLICPHIVRRTKIWKRRGKELDVKRSTHADELSKKTLNLPSLRTPDGSQNMRMSTFALWLLPRRFVLSIFLSIHI